MSMATVLCPPCGTMMSAYRLLGSTKSRCIGLTVLRTLIDHGLDGATPFGDVALQPADEARVGIRVHEYFDVHQPTQFSVCEDEDALDDDGVPRIGFLADRLAGKTREVVDRELDRPVGPELVQVVDEEVRLERIRMIVIERGTLLEPQIVAVTVVPIVLENDDLLWSEAVDDVPDDGRLAGAGSARHADDDRF